MNNKFSVTIENVSKQYKVFGSPTKRLLYSVTKAKKYEPAIFTAIDNLSFNIEKGEILGIVGRNGAGKSTLLKLITGVSFPTSGEIKVNGRIASLLELGAGFNPELSGIDNIYFQGSMLGISKEDMEKRIPAILEFADIGDFIHQPVKNYSSGMFARLAFATASHVDPDILIVDEVLSVGDIAFQFKCIEKMKSFAKEGVTIIFVTHSMMSLYRFCNRAIWINGGKVMLDGTVEDVVPRYEDYVKANATKEKKDTVATVDDDNQYIKFNHFNIRQYEKMVTEVAIKKAFSFYFDYELLHDLEEAPYFALSITKEGVQYDLFGIYPAQDRYTLPKNKGQYTLEVSFKNVYLNVGQYDVYFSISEMNGVAQLFFNHVGYLNITGDFDSLGLVDIEHHISIKTKED